MKWLSLDTIKHHLNIDTDDEDMMLELYGDAAEEAILDITRRTYEELVQMGGGKMPAKLYAAALQLVDVQYNNRSPYTSQQLSTIPYGNFDFLVKNYMKLSD